MNEDKKLKKIDYGRLRDIVKNNESFFVEKNIISIDKKKINKRMFVIDEDAFIEFLDGYGTVRERNINSFIESKNLSLSYATVYQYIQANIKSLIASKVVEIDDSKEFVKPISILSFDDLELLLERR